VQSLIPIVMSGILAVYALVISVLIASDIKPPPEKNYSLYAGFCHMAAGLSVGLSGLAAGYAIGIVGDAVCRTLPVEVLKAEADTIRVYAPSCDSRGSSSAWFLSSFSPKFWVSMGQYSPSLHHPEPSEDENPLHDQLHDHIYPDRKKANTDIIQSHCRSYSKHPSQWLKDQRWNMYYYFV
jgi:F0F1-type ATP synthase membrane subunit c/vacuolar-type H+-ATPase subunit K